MGSGFRVFCKQVLRSFPEIRVVPIRYKYVGFRHDIYIIYIYTCNAGFGFGVGVGVKVEQQTIHGFER